MTSEQLVQLQKHLDTALKPLRDELLKSGMESITADGGKVFPLDLYIAGVSNRAIALLDGFSDHVEAENFICSGALVRLQLDCALRLFAVWLVNDPHDFVLDVIRGKEVRRIKDKDGQLLSDFYLQTRLEEREPWVRRVYKETSGFIHFSDKHIFAALQKKDVPNTIGISIGGKASIPVEAWIEAVDAFAASTRIVLEYIYGWLKTKQRSEN